MQTVQIGSEHFSLDAAIAAEVEHLLTTNPRGALDMARQATGCVRDGELTHVSMLLMDSAPPPVQPTRTQAMPTPAMTNIRVGDADIFIDARAAAEIERLRRETDGQKDVIAALYTVQGGKRVVANDEAIRAAARDAVNPNTDPASAALRDAYMADARAKRDPATAAGKYATDLANAWRETR